MSPKIAEKKSQNLSRFLHHILISLFVSFGKLVAKGDFLKKVVEGLEIY